MFFKNVKNMSELKKDFHLDKWELKENINTKDCQTTKFIVFTSLSSHFLEVSVFIQSSSLLRRIKEKIANHCFPVLVI